MKYLEELEKAANIIVDSKSVHSVNANCQVFVSLLLEEVIAGNDVSKLKNIASNITRYLSTLNSEDESFKRYHKATYTIINNYVNGKQNKKNLVSTAKRVKDIITLFSAVISDSVKLETMSDIELPVGSSLIGGINVNEKSFRNYTLSTLAINETRPLVFNTDAVPNISEDNTIELEVSAGIDKTKEVLDSNGKPNVIITLVSVGSLGIALDSNVESFLIYAAPLDENDEDAMDYIENVVISSKSSLIKKVLGEDVDEEILDILGISSGEVK